VEKTVMLHIGLKNPKRVYTINGHNVIYSDCVRDLGVYVSSNLTWRYHCVEMCKKANRVANSVLHMFKCSNIQLYMKAFDAYVRPIVEYCPYVWNPSLYCDVDMVENIQKSFTRRAFFKCNLPRTSYLDRLKILNRLTLEFKRMSLSLGTFYQIYHKYVNCNVLNDFRPANLHLRGHSSRIFVPFCRTTIRKNFFVFRILPMWNKLPVSIINTNVYKAYLNKLDAIFHHISDGVTCNCFNFMM
jgi:hypothetical protein